MSSVGALTVDTRRQSVYTYYRDVPHIHEVLWAKAS